MPRPRDAKGRILPRTATPSAVPEAANSPGTPPGENTAALDRILSMLTDLTARQEKVESAVAEAKAVAMTRSAGFAPMEAPPGGKPRGKGVFSDLEEAIGGPGRRGWGERTAEGVSGGILINVHGEKIPDQMLERLAPRFVEGDRVRIDPTSTRDGWPEGQTWADVLARTGSPGVGKVRKIYWLLDDGNWKYSCIFKGVTGTRPDGFVDSELLPA